MESDNLNTNRVGDNASLATSPISGNRDANATDRESHNDTPSAGQHDGDVEKAQSREIPPSLENSIERSRGKTALIMAALMLAVFLAALDVTIITTALPTISEDFHSSAGYTWIGSAFLLANAASVPSWGKISDIFGRKPMILLANIVFMVGSLVAALSNSIGMLIAARAVQGIGGGGLVILVSILIGDLFSLRARGAFYGLIGSVWAIAGGIGPLIGGAFTEDVTWRWCFYVNLPLDGLAFVILLLFLDVKTPRTPLVDGLKAIDWLGSFWIVAATLLFLFGLQYGGVVFSWKSTTVICLIVFGVVTFVIFLLWEAWFAVYPVMPTSIFGKLTNTAALAVVFFHGFVFISGSYYLPLYFQAVRNATPIFSGIYSLPLALTLAFTSVGTGIFIRKTGQFLPPIYLGLFLMTLGFGLFIDIDANSSWAKIVLYQIVAGAGIGPLFQSPILALQAHIPPRDIATGTSTLGFVRQLATSISVVIGQVVYQNQLHSRKDELEQVLGPQIAHQLGNNDVGANAFLVRTLPEVQQIFFKNVFSLALSRMWIMYACFAAAGLFAGIGIKRKALSNQHQETETGLQAEKHNAVQRQTERKTKCSSKSPAAVNPRHATLREKRDEPADKGLSTENL